MTLFDYGNRILYPFVHGWQSHHQVLVGRRVASDFRSRLHIKRECKQGEQSFLLAITSMIIFIPQTTHLHMS